MEAGDEKKSELRTLKILKNPNVSILPEGTSVESCVIQVVNFLEDKHDYQKNPGSNAVSDKEVEYWKKLQATIIIAEPKFSQREVCAEIEKLCKGTKCERPMETIRHHLYKKT